MGAYGLDRLECAACGVATAADAPVAPTLCPCGGPLLARYPMQTLAVAGATRLRALVAARPPDLWRYAEVLPDVPRVTLGEGYTPLLPARRLGADLGLDGLSIKDEAQNPTGSFKARGMAVAVSMAKARGARLLAAPSAGNAGSALAAYGARAGLPVRLFFPTGTPPAFFHEARRYGATVVEVPGSIADAGRAMRATLGPSAGEGWCDMATLREPYRLEGKKTMAYEIFEQMGGRLPDVIVYPTGGGTGLIGMWKAFDEMEALGWINEVRPRMYSAQAAGCAPIVRAFDEGAERARPWEDPVTRAAGLRVPASLGDFLMLRALRRSGGGAVAVPDEALLAEARRLGALEGIDACPEGGAAVAALRALVADGRVTAADTVVVFNTGTGLKYDG